MADRSPPPARPAAPEPLHLILGPEELLAERVVSKIVAAARAIAPETELVNVPADQYRTGDLAVHTSPSLFGQANVVVVQGIESASDDFITEAKAFLSRPVTDVTLVLRHSSGTRGKAVLDAAKKAGAQTHECRKISSDGEKNSFVQSEFRSADRKIHPMAAAALVEALGQDLRELANACRQLMADTAAESGAGQVVDLDLVQRYYGGRVEATGFAVADAALAGRTQEALGLVRHALSSGVDPVPLVAVLAMGLRSLAKASGGGSASDLGMAPWQLDKARKQLRGWTPRGLELAFAAVVAADHGVKGGVSAAGRRSGDPIYAVERAILRIGEARREEATGPTG
ncbi:MAG: DNA polymerase III subunit delta [Angustibacter sp.]